MDLFSILSEFTKLFSSPLSIETMFVPFAVGAALGFMVRRFLKWGLVLFLIVGGLTYWGVFGLSWSTIQTYSATLIALISLIPLSLGFLIGLLVGFLAAS